VTRLAVFAAGLLLALSCPAAEPARTDPDLSFCITCHGVDGRGNAGVGAPRIGGMDHWYIARQLRNFRDARRGGHDDDVAGWEMQAMARRLSDDGITAAAAWFSRLDPPAPPMTIEGDADRGKTLYTACAACHGADGLGNQDVAAPRLAGQNDWYLLRQIENFRAGRRGYHPEDEAGRRMAEGISMLRDEQSVRDVVAYIGTLD
jgi:cytochrome c553